MALDALKKYCKSYINNQKIVFKSCGLEWIVVLEKLPDTLTNEKRTRVYDHNHSTFRGNKFKVVNIINKFNFQQIKTIQNTYFTANTSTYKIGEITFADMYDPNIENISSNGIHYFLTIDTAYYFELDEHLTYTGEYMNWYPDGHLRCARRYLNGKKQGNGIELNEWYNNIFVNYKYIMETQKVIKLINNEHGKIIYSCEANY